MVFYPELDLYLQELIDEADLIPNERKRELQRIVGYIDRVEAPAQLNFICTHNSRRSHISQIWATTAAAFYDLDIECYSGGTEATAFNPRAVAAMERAGFQIYNPGGDNPQYEVSYAEDEPVITCFSKTFDDPENPEDDFAAIMTCSHADANCPFIPGATRMSLTYRDPKEADDTPEESERYDERVRQIGRELLFAFSTVETHD